MRIRNWEELPSNMQNESVRPYYDILRKRTCSLIFKRIFDFTVALSMLIIFFPAFIIISIAIAIDSPGGAYFKQVRITQYGRKFKIIKFRTMVANSEKFGTQVTVSGDHRVTRIGRVLRNNRLDELPQLLNVIAGDMSFVGTRPEVVKYVEEYEPEMMATLLLPAGITSEASIMYKDENKLLNASDDVDRTYIEKILPDKMSYNLKAMRSFNFWLEIKTILKTVLAVCGKEYEDTKLLEDNSERVAAE